VRKRNPPPTDPPEFFLDRGLGKRVAEGLAEDDWTIHPMFEVYPRTENRRVEDVNWIPKVTEWGWIILAKDAFRGRPEKKAILDCGARVFSLPHANMKAAEMLERFVAQKERILAACESAGPFHYSVGPDRLRVVRLRLLNRTISDEGLSPRPSKFHFRLSRRLGLD
jgi:hypothetical protein